MSLLRKNMTRIYYFLSVTLDKDDSLDQRSVQTKQREAQVSKKFSYVIQTILYSINLIYLQEIHTNLKLTLRTF